MRIPPIIVIAAVVTVVLTVLIIVFRKQITAILGYSDEDDGKK